MRIFLAPKLLTFPHGSVMSVTWPAPSWIRPRHRRAWPATLPPAPIPITGQETEACTSQQVTSLFEDKMSSLVKVSNHGKSWAYIARLKRTTVAAWWSGSKRNHLVFLRCREIPWVEILAQIILGECAMVKKQWKKTCWYKPPSVNFWWNRVGVFENRVPPIPLDHSHYTLNLKGIAHFQTNLYIYISYTYIYVYI